MSTITSGVASRGSVKAGGASRATGRSRPNAQLNVVGFRSVVEATLSGGAG